MFGVTLYNQIYLQRRYVDGATPIGITPVNGKDPRKTLPYDLGKADGIPEGPHYQHQHAHLLLYCRVLSVDKVQEQST